MSSKKLAIVVVVIAVGILGVVVGVSSCSVRKEVKGEAPTRDSVSKESEGKIIKQEESKKEAEREVESEPKEEVEQEVDRDSREDVVSNRPKEGVMSEVNEPVLGNGVETSVLVSSKSVYNTGEGSYAYAINIVVPLDGDTLTTKYFCSKQVYDGVATGDSIKIVYQMDKYGTISINSVSK